MALPVNVWLSLRDDVHADIQDRLDWETQSQFDVFGQPRTIEPYIGPVTGKQKDFFVLMEDRKVGHSMFSVDSIGPRTWTLWSLYFTVGDLDQIRDRVQDMRQEFPGRLNILGSWEWDGRQAGTDWVDVDDHSQGTTGAPMFPLHPRILEFMPFGVLQDRNLLLGQTERRFA